MFDEDRKIPTPPRMPVLDAAPGDDARWSDRIEEHLKALERHFAHAAVKEAISASGARAEAFAFRNVESYSHFEDEKHKLKDKPILDLPSVARLNIPVQKGGYYRFLMNLQTIKNRVVSNLLTEMLLDLEAMGVLQDGLFLNVDEALFETRCEGALQELEHRRQAGKTHRFSLSGFQREFFTAKVYSHAGFEPDGRAVRVTRDRRVLPAASLGLLTVSHDGIGNGYNLTPGPVLTACITGPVEAFLDYALNFTCKEN